VVMADRPGVTTAAAPVVAIDTVALAEQMVAALARVPFRHPLQGPSTRSANLGRAVTREVLRSFIGYASSLPIPEFRSIEFMLDNLCKVVMPPVVRLLGVKHHSVAVGGVPGILYLPDAGPAEGVMLYLHGGGYIGTSPTMYAFFTALLCRETSCAVFVADYRLAPEFPFPAGVEDAEQVLLTLVDHGVPPERLFLAGDSGGGGLATTLALAAPERLGGRRPAGVILFSPEVDLALDEPSITENARYDILPWNIPTSSYLHGVDPDSPWVSAVDADLTNFPPTALSWGGHEMFRDPIRRFAKRLEDAGVQTDALEIPDMFHVFQILMPWATGTQEVLTHVARFVRERIAGAPELGSDSLARLTG
jgi:epsilon-lactone hydrolase